MPGEGTSLARAKTYGRARRLARSGLVDPAHLARLSGGMPRTPQDAATDFLLAGAAEGLAPNPLFDRHWTAGADQEPLAGGLLGYLGDPERRRTTATHPLFDPVHWVAVHPAAANHPGGPLGHFLTTADPQTPMPVADGEVLWGPAAAALAEAAEGRTPGLPPRGPSQPWASVVVPVAGRPRDAAGVLAASEGDGLALVLVVDPADRGTLGVVTGMALLDARLRVVAGSVRDGLAAAEGEIVLVAPPQARVRPDLLESLRDVLDDGSVAGAVPAVVDPAGLLASTGVVRGTGDRPVPLLPGHPEDDLDRLPERIELAGLTSSTLAVRLPWAQGLTTTWGDPRFVADLARAGTVELVPAARLDLAAAVEPGAPAWAAADVELSGGASAEALWQLLGLTAPHLLADPSSPSGVRALLIRSRDEREAPGGRTAPSLRWSIVTASPSGPVGWSWGDHVFAASLAAALRRLGQDAVVTTVAGRDGPAAYLSDVSLVLRGLARVAPDPAQTNLLWVISHPERVAEDEAAGYEHVLAASVPWAAAASQRWRRPVLPLLQCTDPARFHPGVAHPDSGPPRLFVGNSRNVFRPSVKELLAAGLDLTIYGSGWTRFVGPDVVAGERLSGDDVARAYASAGVVLNDHWDDMRRDGFVSNRVFDVLASGGRLLTDRVEGIEEVGQGVVRTWGTVEELVTLAAAPVEDAFPPLEARVAAAARVAAEHSFDARAAELVALVRG